jgi:RNA polymerase sigma-70 factor (ECF subfamily)
MVSKTGHASSLATELELEDGELWRELAAGNLTALDMLYDRYAGLALGLASRALGDRQAAEDVVQESFLQLWRHASSYDPRRGSLRSWLLSIVHHRCIDALRRRAARPRTVAWMVDAYDHAGTSDTWMEVERKLTRTTVRRALLQLSVEQREAIELSYFEGYSHAQIAERLGLPLGTVKGRLRLGLRRLRGLLEAPDDGRTTPMIEARKSETSLAALLI